MQTLPNPSHSSGIQSHNSAAFDTTIHRRKTRPVPVGDVTIGGGHPVVVQSMINEDTLDIEGRGGIRRLHEIGCEIVRVTVPSMAHAKALADDSQNFSGHLSPRAPGGRCPSQWHENCPGSGQACR
jgi:(E)-4-hydroxy-3-methylbut-2-enyl-diphosphate synthase